MYEQFLTAMRADADDVPRRTAAVLDEVLTGVREVRAVRHPLGFVCLPLERAGERGVCVHVWSARLTGPAVAPPAAHAHNWDLVSYVLYGVLRNDLIGVTDAPLSPTHRVLEIDSGAQADEIRSTSRLVRSQTLRHELCRAGEIYSLPAGIFHNTVVHGETATLALGYGRRGHVDQALGAVHTDSHRTHRQLCGREETEYAAELVTAQLSATARWSHQEDSCERGSR